MKSRTVFRIKVRQGNKSVIHLSLKKPINHANQKIRQGLLK